MLKKTSIMVGLAALVLASCGGGSSETKDTSVTESTDRERNTLVGGFGTDGAGYSDVALGKSNSSWYGQLTSHDNGDGTTNVAVVSGSSKNGEQVLQVLLSRIGKDGAFDTSYGDGGFTYITLNPEHWVSKIMFDSHNNVVVAVGWDTEVPGEKDADGYQVYVSHSELRAYSFATGKAQNDYGTDGVLTDLEKTLGSTVDEVSLGLRGPSADSFNFMTSDGLVRLAADGTQTKFAQLEPKNANMYSRLIDMSYLTLNAFAGLFGSFYDDDGNRLGMEYSLLHPTLPEKSIQGSTTDVSMLDGWDAKQYAVPSSNMAKPLPNIMVITSDGYQVDRGELDTGTNEFLNIDHFSFNENGESRLVSLSSSAHSITKILWDDIHYENGDYNKWTAYGQSKTASSLLAIEFDRKMKNKGVRGFAVHPGGIITPLQRHLENEEMVALGWKKEDGSLSDLATNFFKSPTQGASTTLWCATNPELNNIGGVFCENCDIAELKNNLDESQHRFFGVAEWAIDSEEAIKLWEVTDTMISDYL